MPNPTNNYIGASQFRVFVEGINDPFDGFIKVGAIKSFNEDISFQHGKDMLMRKMPGRMDYEDVVLERVYSGMDEFHAWRKRLEAGNFDIRGVTIQFLRPDNSTLRAYLLTEAYPFELAMPELDGGATNVATEKITLAFSDAILLS